MLVVTRATHEVRPVGMHAGQGAGRDAVAVHIQIPRKLLDLLERGGIEHLAAIGLIAVVPHQALAHPVIHADVEIAGHKHRRLKALGQIERRGADVEALFGAARKEHDMLRVAVRRVGQRHQVALLRAGGHAGGRPRALDIIEDRGNFCVVRETDELLHERDAGARRVREGAGARPAGADRDAGRREFVFRLNDAVLVQSRLRLHAEAFAKAAEGFHERRGRRDGIPRTHRGAGIHRTQASGGVAVDDDGIAGGVHLLEMERQRTGEVRLRVVVAQADGRVVGLEELLFLGELFDQHLPDDVHVDLEQRRERAGVHDVAQQGAVAVTNEGVHAHASERDA